MNKGFKVFLNGKPVDPVDLNILLPKSFGAGPVIEPYVYKVRSNGVEVDLLVGFYRALATERELDSDKLQPQSRDNAGWTVVCNDRVVLHNDKTMRTGWGRGTVPNYHNQFISIAGVVFFRSSDPWKLPLNTTKRGLDTDSLVYMQTLDIMMEGLKKFTDFTNKWKGRERETRPAFNATDSVRAAEVLRRFETAPPPLGWTSVRKTGGDKRLPNLPTPPSADKLKRISFAREKDEVLFLASRLLGDENASPSDVGIRCWEDRLEAERK